MAVARRFVWAIILLRHSASYSPSFRVAVRGVRPSRAGLVGLRDRRGLYATGGDSEAVRGCASPLPWRASRRKKK